VEGIVSQVRERLAAYGDVRFDLAVESVRWVVEVDVHPSDREGDGGARDRRARPAQPLGRVADRAWRRARAITDFALTMDELAISYPLRCREVEALKAAGAWSYDRT
jgi:hypothetical protein